MVKPAGFTSWLLTAALSRPCVSPRQWLLPVILIVMTDSKLRKRPNSLPKKLPWWPNGQRQPYAGRSFKDGLRECDQFGVDHRTYFNATPLMLAAQCGNVALVDALLERGADRRVRDHYGHSAWD